MFPDISFTPSLFMPIQNEEDFKKIKEALQKEDAGFHSDKFQELKRFV